MLALAACGNGNDEPSPFRKASHIFERNGSYFVVTGDDPQMEAHLMQISHWKPVDPKSMIYKHLLYQHGIMWPGLGDNIHNMSPSYTTVKKSFCVGNSKEGIACENRVTGNYFFERHPILNGVGPLSFWSMVDRLTDDNT